MFKNVGFVFVIIFLANQVVAHPMEMEFQSDIFTVRQSETIPDSCNDQNDQVRYYGQGNEIRGGSCTVNQTEQFDSMTMTRQGVKPGKNNANRWPSRTIYYTISDDFTSCHRDLILEAHRQISERTGCIVFSEWDGERDYIRYLPSDQDWKCWSWIGRKGGVQDVLLNEKCFRNRQGGFKTGTAIHETMHALGMFHEHTRTDRDSYVVVNWDNIAQDDTDFNIAQNSDVLGAYEYGSIMHYSEYSHSINNKPTLTAKKRGSRMGVEEIFTQTDVNKIRKLYKC